MQNQFQRIWYATTISNLMSNRRELAVIAGVGALHLGLSLAGLPAWTCPIRAATGVPCPGCGLTTAMLQLLRGDIATSMQTHLFAPIFLVVLLLMAVLLIIPQPYRQTWISTIEKLETRNGLTSWVLLALVFYWGIRLVGIIPFPSTF